MFAKDVKVGKLFKKKGEEFVYLKTGHNPTSAKLAETEKQSVVGWLADKTFFFRRKDEVEPV